MTLHEFLNLCNDGEARIELEIDHEEERDYIYESFWLSDYRSEESSAIIYSKYKVVGFRVCETEFSESDITIMIQR